ncbi:ATP-binding protein [Actinophytocola oryzae]|uniref:histidine kinase n=1 Tax=Actinophytocola oryzae TaxID=502181 RepID=A0A4R7W0L9_9PSEU|nr:ATP-binding protein [Actinophytocola oryzae]TDV56066.1 signal transduction histidine kinase [Actinophytocola oryzae]
MTDMPIVPHGYAEQRLRALSYRYVGVTRAIVVALAALFAVPVASPAGKVVTAILAGILLVWQYPYLTRMRSGNPQAWVIGIDLALVALVSLTQQWTVPDAYLADGIGWVSIVVSISVVALQWYLSLWLAVPVTVLLSVAYGAGAALAVPDEPGAAVAIAAWMLAEGALSRVLYLLVRQGARRADDISARTEASRRQAEVARALRDDEAEHVAVLHDTVANTLLMVGEGVFAARDDWLSRRAGTDLETIGTPSDLPSTAESVALDELLAQVCGQAAVRVDVETVPLAVPGPVATAFCGAVREALGNVAKHAGVDTATVRATRTGRTVTVEVTDAGRGFDTRSSSRRGFGLSGSIEERMDRIHGSATVSSTPGAGTTVRLMWTLAELPPESPSTVGAERFLRGIRVATVLIAGAVLVGMNTPMLLTHLDQYTSAPLEIACFAALALVVLVTAVPIAANRPIGVLRYPLLGLVLLASVVAAADVPAPYQMTAAQWSYGTVGWFVVMLLFDRGLRPVVVFLGVHVGATLVQFALAEQFDSATLLRTLNVSIPILGFQLALGACGHTLTVLAQSAEEDSARAARVITAHETAERLYQHRQGRYAELMPTITPILTGLADGQLDPGDREVRHRCAVAAAVIRRLLAERTDHDDPLVEELRAVMDVALRKGVVVDLLLSGQRPSIPVHVRRALTEPALTVLALAESTARLTIDADETAVTVSVVADASPVDLPANGHPIETTVLPLDERIWVESRWTM